MSDSSRKRTGKHGSAFTAAHNCGTRLEDMRSPLEKLADSGDWAQIAGNGCRVHELRETLSEHIASDGLYMAQITQTLGDIRGRIESLEQVINPVSEIAKDVATLVSFVKLVKKFAPYILIGAALYSHASLATIAKIVGHIVGAE